MQAGAKCGLIEEVRLHGAHPRQADLDHGAESARRRGEGVADMGRDFVQIGE